MSVPRTKMTPAIADELCRRIGDGESLRSVCADKRMPSKDFILSQLQKSAEFAAQYARAREVQADHFADEIIEISDNVVGMISKRKKEKRGPRGKFAGGKTEEDEIAFDAAAVAAARLRIDARKWAAAKMKPKVYGDKLDVAQTTEHSGEIRFITTYETKPQHLIDITPKRSEDEE